MVNFYWVQLNLINWLYPSVSRWVVDMIGQSGINTDVFKARSTRSAATSKMSSVGISLIEIKGRDKR